MIENICEVERI